MNTSSPFRRTRGGIQYLKGTFHHHKTTTTEHFSRFFTTIYHTPLPPKTQKHQKKTKNTRKNQKTPRKNKNTRKSTKTAEKTTHTKHPKKHKNSRKNTKTPDKTKKPTPAKSVRWWLSCGGGTRPLQMTRGVRRAIKLHSYPSMGILKCARKYLKRSFYLGC